MTTLSRSLVASLGARLWVALLSLLAMPIYLRLLGKDDFGVVGFFVSLQVFVNFLDMGLGASLVRKLSMHHQTDPELASRYAKTYERAYVLIGIVALIGLWALAPWMAHHWLNPTPSQLADLPRQLQLAAVSICLTWMSGIYTSMLTGLELQTRLAAIQSIIAALRFAIPIAVLCVHSDLTWFFIAHAGVAIVQWIIFRSSAAHQLQGIRLSGRTEWALLMQQRQFSLGLVGIMSTTFLITQLDKVILSKMLALTDFGIYSLCVTLASGIHIAVQPLFNILYPRFSRLTSPDFEENATRLYRLGAQIMALLVIPIASSMVVFAPEVLWILTGDRTIMTQGANTLVFLVLANSINAVMNLPYALQLSHGWSTLPMKVNFFALIFLTPSMLIATEKLGATGASIVIFSLYFLILMIVPAITHKRLLKNELQYWSLHAVWGPTLVCAVLSIIGKLIWDPSGNRVLDFFALVSITSISLLAVVAISPELKRRVAPLMKSSLRTRSPIKN